jgi:hypothetical protein
MLSRITHIPLIPVIFIWKFLNQDTVNIVTFFKEEIRRDLSLMHESKIIKLGSL